jgi:aminoglycoside phosphotransferase (APT) family kinase protein
MARADELSRGLVAYLRHALGAPALDLDGALEPLGGGFDTEIHAFRLRVAPPGFAGPLVLRLLRPHHDPARVTREQATQNALAAQGYPAPCVVLASLDPAPLGAAFLIMERAPGVPLLSRVVGMAGVLVDAQARLHALDPGPLRGTLPEFDDYLDALGRRVEAASLGGLAPLLAWLRARRPPPGDVVVCHGDFHPQNVMVDGAAVSGVLDWANAVLAEPAFDVAATFNILRRVPAGVVVPGPRRWLAAAAQRLLAARYLAGYRRRRPVDPPRLAYYEVAAALRALVRGGEVRGGTPGAPPPSALDRSPYAARLLARVARITGLEASLP